MDKEWEQYALMGVEGKRVGTQEGGKGGLITSLCGGDQINGWAGVILPRRGVCGWGEGLDYLEKGVIVPGKGG